MKAVLGLLLALSIVGCDAVGENPDEENAALRSYSPIPRSSSEVVRFAQYVQSTPQRFIPQLFGLQLVIASDGDIIVSAGQAPADSFALWRFGANGQRRWRKTYSIRSSFNASASADASGFVLAGPRRDVSDEAWRIIHVDLDGNEIWTHDRPQRVGHVWSSADGGALVGDKGRLTKITATGHTAWTVSLPEFVIQRVVPIQGGEAYFVLGGSGDCGSIESDAAAARISRKGDVEWRWNLNQVSPVTCFRRGWTLPDGSLLAVSNENDGKDKLFTAVRLTSDGSLLWRKNSVEWDSTYYTYRIRDALHAQMDPEGRVSLLTDWESTAGFEHWMLEIILDENGEMIQRHVSDVEPRAADLRATANRTWISVVPVNRISGMSGIFSGELWAEVRRMSP